LRYVRRRQTLSWKLLTNHGQVLLSIAQDGDITLRDLGQAVGITEGTVQRIVADLVESGFIERRRMGRRNHYAINRTTTMRNIAKLDQIRQLLDLLQQPDQPEPPEGRTR
jgi:DNA-binding MarR family transcriptional regulator